MQALSYLAPFLLYFTNNGGRNMDNINARFKKHIGRCMSIAVCILLIATSLSVAFEATSIKNASNNRLSYSFTFIEPGLQTAQMDNSQYTSLHMPGCMAIGKQSGSPMLPVKSVKLLLPAMTMVTSVNVVGTPVELTSIETSVYPYQNPVPIGFELEEFRFNTELYASDEVYPSALHDGYHIGYCRGYTIMDITLNPVQYIPSDGRLFYYPKLTITIGLEGTGYVNPFLRDNPDDKTWVEMLVFNPEVAESYTGDIPTFDYPGGLCDPSDDYDYVIITTEALFDFTATYNWDDLIDKKESEGLQATKVRVEDIFACSDYDNSDPLFNDIEAHVREFCKDAYQDWGTQYILVGGDQDGPNKIVRRLLHYGTGMYQEDVESDLYWSNLDNSFNEDHDRLWGESGDAGFDNYSELYIGSIPCDTGDDVSNWLTKSFYYADATDKDYLENAAFYGGDTTWACQGDDMIDFSAIKGTDDWLGPNPHASGPWPTWLGFLFGFETWNNVNPGNEYNLSVKWTAEPPNPGWQGGSKNAAITGLRNAISNDHVTLLSGVAHANADMSLDVGRNSWESDYHNTKPFFIHDYGCHCGDMDAQDDGILHSMLFHNDTELAFACVYNTGYGWGNYYCTNSSSSLQQKLFWDYLFDVANNSGSPNNWQLGKAMAYSKDTMSPTINWTPGYEVWRGVIQGCLLFGDPAQQVKTMTRPPETPERPAGPTDGVVGFEYTFSTSTVDPDGDKVYYMWDWNDSTYSDWLGPFDSGETAYASHIWTEADYYEIRVKAKDVHNVEGDNWSPPLMVYIADVPVLEIEDIHGSLFEIGLFKISVVIKNNGSADAMGVDWSITLDGGLIFMGKETTGRIMSIPAGENITVKSNLICGLGKTTITATTEIDVSSDTKDRDAFVFLIFIKIIDQ